MWPINWHAICFPKIQTKFPNKTKIWRQCTMPSNRLYLIQNHEEDSYNSTVTSKPPSFTYLTEFGRPHKETKVQNIVLQCLSLRNWFIRLIFFPAEIVLLPREQNFPSKRFQGSCSSPADMHHRIIFRATFTRNTKWTILKAIQ